jgi:hypothetical protein
MTPNVFEKVPVPPQPDACNMSLISPISASHLIGQSRRSGRLTRYSEDAAFSISDAGVSRTAVRGNGQGNGGMKGKGS